MLCEALLQISGETNVKTLVFERVEDGTRKTLFSFLAFEPREAKPFTRSQIPRIEV
jgi:hypothetical protein